MGRRRAWTNRLLVPFIMVAGLTAFIGGWLIYLAYWPMVRLLRRFTRFGVIGRASGAGVLVVACVLGLGFLLDAVYPTVHPTWVNDTGRALTIDGCTDDPASLQADERTSGPFVSAHDRSCSITLDDQQPASECLQLPEHLSDRTVLRIIEHLFAGRSCG